MGRETHTPDRFTIARPDGAVVPVACAVSTLKGDSADQAGALAVIHDLTLVQELEREREEAERLSMVRVLAAGMAHEIRNPLVAIQTFADLLPLKWEDAEFRETFTATAQGEIQRIVGLVSELLMLSKPAGAVSNPVDIAEVCEGVRRTLSARAESLGIRLFLELGPLNGKPRGDANRLTQALQNLVGNALDAEPEGGEVHLIAEQTAGSNGKGRVILRVVNPHSVIAAADQEEIFKPFYSRKEGGTGLGLAICETIVHEHRGTINVSSSPREGTEFTIRLPVGGEDAGADQPEAEG
jgi:signal transduction histidine kinase